MAFDLPIMLTMTAIVDEEMTPGDYLGGKGFCDCLIPEIWYGHLQLTRNEHQDFINEEETGAKESSSKSTCADAPWRGA
jgi:hypothetical protein